MGVVLLAKAHGVLVHGHQALAGRRRAVCIATEVSEHGGRSGQRALGVDHPGVRVHFTEQGLTLCGSASVAVPPANWRCPASQSWVSAARKLPRNTGDRTFTGNRNPARARQWPSALSAPPVTSACACVEIPG
jgi:hypothetical protein